jgi:hypothetical protein
MPKRISKPKWPVAAVKPARRGPSELTKSWANHFSNHQATDTPIGRWPPEQREAYVRAWAEGTLSTGPERTPLRPWTPEQVEAYKKQRIEETLSKDDDMQELP